MSTENGSWDLKYSIGMKEFSVLAARKRAVRIMCLGWVVKGVSLR